MSETDYRALLFPIFKDVCRMFEDMEAKHGEGLTPSWDDVPKSVRHAISYHMGEDNPDGDWSHAVAAIGRLMKAEATDREII